MDNHLLKQELDKLAKRVERLEQKARTAEDIMKIQDTRSTLINQRISNLGRQ